MREGRISFENVRDVHKLNVKHLAYEITERGRKEALTKSRGTWNERHRRDFITLRQSDEIKAQSI